MASLGTGFLYNWGFGSSGSNFVPVQLSGTLVSGIAGGENFNSTIVPFSLPVITPTVAQSKKNYGSFGFGIFNKNETRSPLDKIEITSTFSGLESGRFLSGNGIDSGFYVSGDSFSRRLILATISADPGISIDRAIINLGETLGTGSGKYIYPQDTYIESKKNRLNYLQSDSWKEFSGEFQKYNITGIAEDDAGIIIKDLGAKDGIGQGINLYEIDYGTKDYFLSGSLIKQKLILSNLGVNYPILEQKSSVNKSWASYDVKSGITKNSKNVFAYAFEFVDLVTTRDSGVIITSGTQNQDPFFYYRKLQTPVLTTGFDTSFSTYIGYCFNRLECPEEPKEAEDSEVCYTGSATTGKEYADFLSGVLAGFASKQYVSEFDVASSLVSSSGEAVSGLFAFQTGEIFYNTFFTGDTLTFNLYNFDYTGLYKSYHLNNDPVYPATGFTIRYPNDFTDIDTLTNILNTKLSNINYPVWYPYDCLSGEATGIYITGGLMFFEKNTGIETGNKDYNNIINFKSLRNYQRGFDLKLNLINRDEYLDDLNRQIFRKGFSYLIPNVIELQALTGDQWLVLDRRSGLYDSLTGLSPTQKSLDAPPELFTEEGEDYLSSSDITGAPKAEEFSIEEILLSGGFVTLQKFRQRGFVPAPAYCSQNIFEREVTIIQPTGWPSGRNPCDPSSLFDDEGEEEGDGEEEGAGTEEDKLELFLEVKRTGWYLDPTGIYLNCLTSPDYNLNKVNFSKYRIVAKDFSGLKPSIENQYIIPKNEIYFTNINLFSLEDSPIGVHTGQAQCLIGSDYTVDVQDIVALPFSTQFEYSITGEDRSGIYRALNQQILYTPTTQERDVKFIRESGQIIGNATGFVNGTFTGSGQISHIFGNRYFYDPAKQEVYFSQEVSSGVLRSGILSGDFTVIKDFIINQELLVGGRLAIRPIYFETVTGGVFTGLLTGVRYLQTGVLGLYNLTGQVTGFSNSGYFDYNQLVSGVFEAALRPSTGEFINFTNIISMNRISDNIDSNIYIYRDTAGSIFNTGFQSSWYDNDWSNNSGDFYGTPAYTLWNRDGWSGFTGVNSNSITGREFVSLYNLWGGGQIGNNIVGKELIMWDILNKKYYAIKFAEWQAGGGGQIAYDRSLINFVSEYENNLPYYPIPTGLIQSSGGVLIDFNKIQNFDKIFINDLSVTYNTDTGLYFPPDYFNNVDSLLNIINTNSDFFFCTGTKINNSGFNLVALPNFAPGISGNDITISSNGSGFILSSSSLTGGKNLYPILLPLTSFSGIANGKVASTGFYYENGSGLITGNIPTFTGVRSFTGVWGLLTGQDFDFISYIGNNYLNGISGFISTGEFTDTNNNLQLLVTYDNELNLNESETLDIAELSIKDLNYLNVFPSGTPESSGSLIFRITGIQ